MKKYVKWLGLIAVLVVAVTVVLNQQWINDYLRGFGYEPEGEMGRIMRDLGLTERGEFLFKASRPELSSQDEFNTTCRTVMDEEMAVLGCYVGDSIYVYNIESAELDGIRELTTAHELLHAVWARMSLGERSELDDELSQALKANQSVLGEELEAYDDEQRQEELFVRAGTEVANLPAELEKVYGEVFRDQDKVVRFYDKYIGVFREMEREMEELTTRMERIQTEINGLSGDYERRVDVLNSEIDDFNACADTAGCFESEGTFYSRRAVLVGEQEALEGMYNQINGLVDQYNELVEKYNADVTRTEKLNRVMNSNSRPEEL
ncbi:hypothetical protein IJG22_01940 [Candidatus Saccharibacteria bacterium]|nr:hypothetical protein [Candidatus Saccharibacteria bacterium]